MSVFMVDQKRETGWTKQMILETAVGALVMGFALAAVVFA